MNQTSLHAVLIYEDIFFLELRLKKTKTK